MENQRIKEISVDNTEFTDMSKVMRVLFVCTGNTCRSPMAEGLFRDKLRKNNIDNIMCQSAGIAAVNGEKASEFAIEAMKEIGIDISSHEARRITPDELGIWDIYFTMSETHGYILEQAGVERDKIFVPKNIADPYGGSLEDYRKTREELSEEIDEFYIRVTGIMNNLFE